jgi:gliding motility-associated protein GldL
MKLLNKLKKLNKIELLNKRRMNFAYCLGASIVIIGAWMKITHQEILGVGGNTMLTIGLLTEALIFFLAAFEKQEPVYDWTRAFPELEKQDKIERKLYDIKVNEKELKALNRLKV